MVRRLFITNLNMFLVLFSGVGGYLFFSNASPTRSRSNQLPRKGAWNLNTSHFGGDVSHPLLIICPIYHPWMMYGIFTYMNGLFLWFSCRKNIYCILWAPMSIHVTACESAGFIVWVSVCKYTSPMDAIWQHNWIPREVIKPLWGSPIDQHDCMPQDIGAPTFQGKDYPLFDPEAVRKLGDRKRKTCFFQVGRNIPSPGHRMDCWGNPCL